MPPILNYLLKLILFLLAFLLVLLSIAIFRTVILYDVDLKSHCDPKDADYISDSRGLSRRLAMSITFKTVNFGPHNYDRKATADLIKFLTDSFQLVHSSPLITREVVNNLSLLYYIKGSDVSLKPYLLAGHLDVVPVEEAKWEVPPFKGEIKDGFIWGRGSIDCKHLVLGSLEALEFLLENGYQPRRSFYLAFGHDEESSGLDGAQHIAELLKSRHVELEYILDEGTFVIDGLIPGVNSPVALIGVSEKGSLDLELSVKGLPGHSSVPPKETSIVILAKALAKLEGNVFPSMFGKGPEEEMLQELSKCATFPFKVLFRNLWLFKPLIVWRMEKTIMNAVLRTTTAVTVVSGGSKGNVLPGTATAHVNHRIHPAQTIEEAVDFVKQVINDNRVKVKILSAHPPHPLSPINTFGFSTIKNSVRQIYNDSCVIPITMVANTDTRWYLNLTTSIYRFSLVRMKPEETSRFHGHNERIRVVNYVHIVNFYLHLIKNSDKLEQNMEHSHSNEL